MNQYMVELVDQAHQYACDVIDEGEHFGDIMHQKLVELVVRECALTAGLMEHDQRKNIGAAILDRFGISQ